MEDAKAEGNEPRVTLSYTPPIEYMAGGTTTRETTLSLGESIWVGGNPGHSGMRLDARDDNFVSARAVEISFAPEGVQLEPNNLNPMQVHAEGSDPVRFPPPDALTYAYDGCVEIFGGEHGDVTHRVSWKLSNFTKKARLGGGTSLKFATNGEWVFKELDEKSHLVTCAALVAPRYIKLELLPENRVPNNVEVAQLKGKEHRTGHKDVENLRRRIQYLYTQTSEPSPPTFASIAGRGELVEWICQYGYLDRATIRTLLPGLDQFKPQ